jgi:hypothetical protein
MNSAKKKDMNPVNGTVIKLNIGFVSFPVA